MSESSLGGTGSNLVDMGRSVVRVILGAEVAPARRLFFGGLSVRNVCGVLAGAIGVKLGASLVNRNQVNVGTIPGPPLPRLDPGARRVGVIAHRQVRGGAESS